jgi:hypothetical protein
MNAVRPMRQTAFDDRGGSTPAVASAPKVWSMSMYLSSCPTSCARVLSRPSMYQSLLGALRASWDAKGLRVKDCWEHLGQPGMQKDAWGCEDVHR